MSAHVVRQLVLTLAVITAAATGCSQHQDQSGLPESNDSCEAKASRAELDEQCAIELSKMEIAQRFSSEYSKYNVRFDSSRKLWVVMVYDEDGPPDNHVFLLVTPTGRIEELTGGK